MNGIERKLAIMKKIQEEGQVSVAELAAEYNVSLMTIRRDLGKFAKEGLITLEYGGAILNNGALFEYNMTLKQEEYKEEKKKIAEVCATYISEGDSIFLDAGTTICELARLLVNRKNLIVMTHSLLVANVLSKSSTVEVIMCPGKFRETSMAYMGQLTDNFISSFKVDKLFLAVEGVADTSGVSVPNIIDGMTKQNLVKCSKQVICATDSSKFGKEHYFNICGLTDIDIIVTDCGLSEEVAKNYQDKVKLVRV